MERVLRDPRILAFSWMKDLVAEYRTLATVRAPYNAWLWLAKRTMSRLTTERLKEIKAASGWVIEKTQPGPLRHNQARVPKDGQVTLAAARLCAAYGNMVIARDGNDVLLTAFW